MVAGASAAAKECSFTVDDGGGGGGGFGGGGGEGVGSVVGWDSESESRSALESELRSASGRPWVSRSECRPETGSPRESESEPARRPRWQRRGQTAHSGQLR